MKINPNEIKQLRADGWTLQQLAERYDVSRAAVSLYLSRKRTRTNHTGTEARCAQCAAPVRVSGARRQRFRVFCSRACYHTWYPAGRYTSWRHGQHLARQVLVNAGVLLQPGYVVHHEDRDCRNNAVANLWIFASHADHMSYHRGGVGTPIWRGDGGPCGEPSGLIETVVRQLLAKEHVLTARKLINALPAERLSAESLQLRNLLAEPVVRRRLPARGSRSADLDWLRSHANEYRGKWVAVADGNLLDSDESLDALLRRLRQNSPGVAPFLHRL